MLRLIAIAASVVGMPPGTQADTRLPAYILELPASVADVLVAETTSSKLHRFGRGTSAVSVRDEYYMSIGENGVGKQKAWDRRTPLGIYFITEQLDTSRLDEKYGVTAFTLDYPNEWDRRAGRSGSGIWIHGVSPRGGKRPPLDTDGCLALPNEELLALVDRLVPLVTPVIITRKIRWLPNERIDRLRKELRTALDAWVRSYESGDLYDYLSLYADDFSHRGMSKSEWSAFRLRTFDARAVDKVSMDDVVLLAEPEEEDLYLSRFRYTVSADGRETTTTKRLYWRHAAYGAWRIVAEDNG